VFTSGLIAAALDLFSRQFPRVIVRVTPANNITQGFRPLRDRTVDALVAGFPSSHADDDLELEFLYEDKPFIVSGRTSRWARRRKISLSELTEDPWLLPGEGIFVTMLEDAFRASGLAMPEFGIRSYSVHQRMMLLATDRFLSAEVGSVLRFNANRYSLSVLPVNLDIRPWPVWIITLKNRTVSPVVETFLNLLRECARALAVTK
jgi:DNA-binding transcriptional LysR family regulator